MAGLVADVAGLAAALGTVARDVSRFVAGVAALHREATRVVAALGAAASDVSRFVAVVTAHLRPLVTTILKLRFIFNIFAINKVLLCCWLV